MKTSKKLGLSLKLVLVMLGASILLMCCIAAVEWCFSVNKIKHLSDTLSMRIGTRLEVSIWLPLSEDNNNIIHEILNAEVSRAEVACIQIYRQNLPEIPMLEVWNPAVPVHDRDLDHVSRGYTSPFVASSYTICNRATGEEIGKTIIYLNSEAEYEAFFSHIQQDLFKSFVLVLLLAIILFILLKFFLVAPMERLRRMIEAVRKMIRAGYIHEALTETQTIESIHKMPLHFSEIDEMSIGFSELTNAIYNHQMSLEKSEENLSIMLNSIGDGVIAIDANGKIIQMNPAAEKIIGRPFSECFEAYYADILHLSQIINDAPVISPLETVLKTGKTVEQKTTIRLLSPDGIDRYVDGISSPLYSKEGAMIGAVMIIHDKTEKHSLESQIKNAQKMEMVGRLAGGIAHDLNNMLCGISGATDLLMMSGISEKQKEHVRLITHSMHSVSQLIKELLGFSRKESNITSHVDLNRIVRDTVALIHPSVSGVTLKMKRCPYRLTINGDRTQLQSVLLNIGINARDAMTDGGVLSFSTRTKDVTSTFLTRSGLTLKPGKYAVIEVSDTGVGIPEMMMEKMFDPFFTTKDPGRGTGLGLAMVYGSVKDHGGAVDVHSQVGKGTVFEIYLPLVTATPESESDCEAVIPPVTQIIRRADIDFLSENPTLTTLNPPAAPTGLPHILLIDDDFLIRRLALAILSEYHYPASEARDGHDGLHKALTGEYHLIIADMMMPDLTGIEIINDLREKGVKTPVILISGLDENDERIVPLTQIKNVSFLKKPFSCDSMIRAIQTFFPVAKI